MILLSFEAYLRAREALNLRWRDIVFSDDVRMTAYTSMGLNVSDAKTSKKVGETKFVSVDCPLIATGLRLHSTERHQDDFISALLTYSSYLVDVKNTAEFLGLEVAKLTPHFTGVGAETSAYMSGRHI